MRRLVILVLIGSFDSGMRSARAETEPLPDPPVVLSASRTDVWKALTTAEGIAATDGGQAVVDLRPGGAIRWHSDPRAEADAAGWTSRSVLVFVAPRLLVLADDAPATWTVIELDELDSRRTRMRIEHAGVAAGSKVEMAAEETDRALVVRLSKRFPVQPDPVVAALSPLVGAWEERADGGVDVVARWTIAVETKSDVATRESPAILLERRLVAEESVDRWVFWREAESGRWVGGLVDGARSVGWEIDSQANGTIWLENRWDDLAPRAMSIGAPARDGSVRTETIVGCFGEEQRWTRAVEAK